MKEGRSRHRDNFGLGTEQYGKDCQHNYRMPLLGKHKEMARDLCPLLFPNYRNTSWLSPDTSQFLNSSFPPLFPSLKCINYSQQQKSQMHFPATAVEIPFPLSYKENTRTISYNWELIIGGYQHKAKFVVFQRSTVLCLLLGLWHRYACSSSLPWAGAKVCTKGCDIFYSGYEYTQVVGL